jgi:uncharacterized repeat protein (TIGR01451 family)
MATITSISNVASAEHNGSIVESSAAVTQLLLDPTIEKTVDKSVATIGEILTYTVTIENVSEIPISNVTFSDDIPVGSNYVVGSFTVNGVTVTPTITESVLSYSISSIPASSSMVISFQAIVVGGEN